MPLTGPPLVVLLPLRALLVLPSSEGRRLVGACVWQQHTHTQLSGCC